MVRGRCRFDQPGHFLFAQDHWQPFRAFRVDQIDVAIWSAKHFAEKEPQCGDPSDDRVNSEFALV
jgi:hypothetical protein